jgi:hypothetical protein
MRRRIPRRRAATHEKLHGVDAREAAEFRVIMDRVDRHRRVPMKNRAKLRNVVLAGALAAATVTATAWAASLVNESYVTRYRPVWSDVERDALAPAPRAPLALAETLEPNETVVTPGSEVDVAPRSEPRFEPRNAPLAERRMLEPPIRIEERRLTLDERIQADVMDRIATTANISGKIGVESRGAVVTLTGYTSTAGQAHRVIRVAQGVDGVKEVQSRIRARVGGSV